MVKTKTLRSQSERDYGRDMAAMQQWRYTHGAAVRKFWNGMKVLKRSLPEGLTSAKLEKLKLRSFSHGLLKKNLSACARHGIRANDSTLFLKAQAGFASNEYLGCACTVELAGL